jgi:hypothetical protein
VTEEGRRETVAPLRLFGLDAARGVALLGMFAAHTILGGGERIFDGRSAILFATVAGVSLGLITGGATPPPSAGRAEARVRVLIRGAVLILLGAAMTAFLQPPIGVILDYYGFAFLLLVPVLFLARPLLGILAAVIAFAAPPIVAAVTAGTPYAELAEPVQVFARWLVYGEYPVLIWLAFLLVGLLLARADLSRRLTAMLALTLGTMAAVLGYASAAVIPNVVADAHSGTTAEVIGSGGVAVAVIGGLSLLDSAHGRIVDVLRAVLSPIAAAGAMVLTLYTAHAIVLAIIRVTSADPERWNPPGWTFPALAIATLVVAVLWRRFVGTGPLEAGLRALTRFAVPEPARPRVAP